MNTASKIALIYVLCLASIVWGYMIGQHQVFPYSIINELQEYTEGHELGTDTSTLQKVINDIGIRPTRYMRTYPDFSSEWGPGETIEVESLKNRRHQPIVYVDDEHREGYRAVFGALDYKQSFWGGVLLDENGQAIHNWYLNTDHLATAEHKAELRNLYGLHLLSDGSIIFTQQEDGGGIVRVDACSNEMWSLEGEYHHTISATSDEKTFWTYGGRQEDFNQIFVEVSVETGEVLRRIPLVDIRAANPFVHIFNLQTNETLNVIDISHGNDIEPLPPELAAVFPDFEVGDLVASFRTHNLIFVFNPDTKKIKWWRIGSWDRQHDPDWESDGRIVVFSNNEVTPRHASDIVAIDPKTFEEEVLVEGKAQKFYSRINGNHQRSDFYNTRMVASTTQGRAFEVDENGKVVFSFINNYDTAKRSSLNVSEAMRLPTEFFTNEFWKQCKQ